MTSVSVVIPVKDGAHHLDALLSALTAERPDEILVVDSGSTDGSLEIAAGHNVRLITIPPSEFGHGRTRNFAAAETTGDLICFLTQDAVPEPGWLAAYRDAFARIDHLGAAYGPHEPWPDTSPMIARELTEFFASMSADGAVALQREGDSTFLSNVNACYSRKCLSEIGFADVDYAEDQAFGVAMLAAGWAKAYIPQARVRHAHDYGPVEFARRYFDEARGLAETMDHRAPLDPRRLAGDVRRSVRDDRRWMRAAGYDRGQRTRWTARAALHHASRKGAEALGTRHTALPARAQQALSLEGRSSPTDAQAAPHGRLVPARGRSLFDEILQVERDGPTPLLAPRRGRAERETLHVAFVVPPYARGSGGHNTIFTILRLLENRGHSCTVWMHDPLGKIGGRYPGVLRQEIRNWFGPIKAPVFVGFDDWHGADVVVATGWDTAHKTATLPGCAARAYFVQDHEPEFYATSAESLWAESTYGLGLFPICASSWLRDLVAERHGVDGVSFRLGVDSSIYHPELVERRRDTVICYCRGATARRGVPLALLAIEELCRRRPDTRVVLFGQTLEIVAGFDYELLGVASPGQLARSYGDATVGLCLSLTNYSLIPQEMMACGLPCVDVVGGSSEAVFGSDGPVELRPATAVGLADGVERLLEDRPLWDRRSAAGLDFVADADWELAADQVEAGLRQALREREALT